MAEVATKPKPATQSLRAHELRVPAALFDGAVHRTSGLSDDVLKTLETGQRGTIEALGAFVITLEEALPKQVAGTSEMVKKVTESGLEMTDRLVHTDYHFVRSIIEGVAKSLSAEDGAARTSAR
jgi:hypothetical protein